MFLPIINTESQAGVISWLMERDLSQRIIKTDNLKAFLARRRWQRCGQAIRWWESVTTVQTSQSQQPSSSLCRALRRLNGGRSLSNSPSTSAAASPEASPSNSAAASPLASPLASPAASQVSSPVLGRKAAPLAEALVTSAKLNLLEEKLKQELDAGRLIMWVDEDEIEWELIFEKTFLIDEFWRWLWFFSGKVRESQKKYLKLMLRVNRVQVSQKIRDKNVDAWSKRGPGGQRGKKSPWFISALVTLWATSIVIK